MGDTTQVIHFYPTKFVYISEVLDTFGNLVFERLKMRSAITLDDGTSIPLKVPPISDLGNGIGNPNFSGSSKCLCHSLNLKFDRTSCHHSHKLS